MIVLSGDIGGTYTRIRLMEFSDNSSHVIKNALYHNGDHSTFINILDLFFDDVRIAASQLKSAGFGVAGPIVDGVVKFTNLPWMVKSSDIQKRLSLEKVALLNDFAAIGHGLETLHSEELVTLQRGKSSPDSPKAYIGAGTGLGIGFISYHRGVPKVHATEGGHIDFAPTNGEQIDLLRFLKKKYHRVSLERLLSGPGLINIYQFVRSSYKTATKENSTLASFTEKNRDFASAITEYALRGGDPLAKHALDIFIGIYGAAVGNLALTTLPFGGIYIVGGIAPKLLSQIKGKNFLQAFSDKGRLQQLIQDIPLHIVLCTEIGLRGAALYAKKLALDQID